MIKWKLVAALCAFAVPSAALAQDPARSDRSAPPRLIAGSINNMDYPAAAIRAREQGSVRMRISVSADGFVTNCEIASSSGSQVLDTQTCALATQRFRFAPGRNERGEAAPSVYRQSVRWVLPDDLPAEEEVRMAFAPFRIVVVATVRNGQVVQCTQEGLGAPAQPMELSACSGVLASALAWSVPRPDVVQLTQIVSLTPLPAPPAAIRREWGAALNLAEAEMRIAPDGSLIDCTFSRREMAPDSDGFGPADVCTLSGGRDSGTAFEPAAGTETRRARVLIATFARRRR